MTSERTLEMVPPKTELNIIASGGKRLLEGGLDSPSKRAQKYIELKDFWGGGDLEKICVYLHNLNLMITIRSNATVV